MQVFYWIIFTFINLSYSKSCLTQEQDFPFLLAKKMQPEPETPQKRRLRLSAPANKKIGSGNTL